MSPAPGRTEESPEQKGFKGSELCDVGTVIILLQRIAMTLTRMHATDTPRCDYALIYGSKSS
jgi:hypothetical protein